MAIVPDTTPSVKSITLAPGECFVLPKDAVVQSIVTSGAINVTSNCGTLPAPTSYKCGVFYYFLDDTTEDDDTAMEEEHVTFTKLVVGGTTYTLAGLAKDASPANINMYIIDQALFQVMEVAKNLTPDDRQLIAVYFQTPEDLFDLVYLQISDRGTLYNLPPNEATCEEYPIPE